MEGLLNVNLSNEIDKEVFFNLFKSKQSDLNAELFAKISSCETYYDFFNLYTGVDLNTLFNTINLFSSGISSIISDNNLDNVPYFTIISKIVISLEIVIKLKNILEDCLNKIKKYTNKFLIKNDVNPKLKSKIKNSIEDLLNQLTQRNESKKLEKNYTKSSLSKSLFASATFNEKESKIVKKENNNIVEDFTTPKFNKPLQSAKNFSSFLFSGDKIKDNLTQNKTSDNISKEIDLSITLKNFNSNTISPSVLKLEKKENNKKMKRNCSCLNCSDRRNKRDNIEIVIKNIENNLNFSFGEEKTKNSKSDNSKKKRLSKFSLKTPSSSLDKEKIKQKSPTSNSSLNADMFFNLLQIINESFKGGLINAEEKLILKQVIISKSKLVFDIYQKFYLNANIEDINNKKLLIDELKKIHSK